MITEKLRELLSPIIRVTPNSPRPKFIPREPVQVHYHLPPLPLKANNVRARIPREERPEVTRVNESESERRGFNHEPSWRVFPKCSSSSSVCATLALLFEC